MKIRQDIGFSRTKDHVVAIYTKKKLLRFNFQDKLTFHKFMMIFSQVETESSLGLPVYIPTSFVCYINLTGFISQFSNPE